MKNISIVTIMIVDTTIIVVLIVKIYQNYQRKGNRMAKKSEELEEQIDYVLKCHGLYGDRNSYDIRIIRKEILEEIEKMYGGE